MLNDEQMAEKGGLPDLLNVGSLVNQATMYPYSPFIPSSYYTPSAASYVDPYGNPMLYAALNSVPQAVAPQATPQINQLLYALATQYGQQQNPWASGYTYGSLPWGVPSPYSGWNLPPVYPIPSSYWPLPPSGTQPPPSGTQPPPSGTQPPPSGTQPPPYPPSISDPLSPTPPSPTPPTSQSYVDANGNPIRSNVGLKRHPQTGSMMYEKAPGRWALAYTPAEYAQAKANRYAVEEATKAAYPAWAAKAAEIDARNALIRDAWSKIDMTKVPQFEVEVPMTQYGYMATPGWDKNQLPGGTPTTKKMVLDLPAYSNLLKYGQAGKAVQISGIDPTAWLQQPGIAELEKVLFHRDWPTDVREQNWAAIPRRS